MGAVAKGLKSPQPGVAADPVRPSPASAPPVGPSAATRRPGPILGPQVEIHDRQQLEIRLSHAIDAGPGSQRYTVDAYFFVPRNVGLGRANYTRGQFYADVTTLMRLDASAVPLDELADPSSPRSPLAGFARHLDNLRHSPRPPPSSSVAMHVRLYAFLYTVGVKRELQRLLDRLRDGALAPAAFERELAAMLERSHRALVAFRTVRSSFWPYEKLLDGTLAEAMRHSDEYMSLFLEEHLTLFDHALSQETPWLDGSGFVARCRLRAAHLAREEAAYRRRYGYLALSDRELEPDGEHFTYHASALKKAVHQALYLDPREVRADTFVRNAVGAFGAALAATWALATQVPATLADVPGETKSWLFAAAVAAYVLKDRIKFVTNEYLTPRLRRHDNLWRLQGTQLALVGLEGLRATLSETMRFRSPAQVPEPVRELRARQGLRVEPGDEEVIHYRKVLELGTEQDQAPAPPGYRVRDILRLNVRHFLVRLDDPVDHVAYFDDRRSAFASAQLPKVYHLNVVLRVQRRGEDGTGEARLEHLRVVLNKEGIVRVEQAGGAGAAPLPPRPVRWWRKLLRAAGRIKLRR